MLAYKSWANAPELVINNPDKFENMAANAPAMTSPSSHLPPSASAVVGITILFPPSTKSRITSSLAVPEIKIERPTTPKNTANKKNVLAIPIAINADFRAAFALGFV